MERGRVLRRPHFLSNANTALQFLASKRIKLVNINPADLVDGRPPVVLGLIWTIILYFQVSDNQYQSHSKQCKISIKKFFESQITPFLFEILSVEFIYTFFQLIILFGHIYLANTQHTILVLNIIKKN